MVYSTEQQPPSMEQHRLKPLHNFDLPCLKWGNQKLLRCIKVVHPDDDDVASVKKRFRSSSSPSSSHKMKSMMIGDEDEIEATREKLMLDFHKEVGKIKDAILKQRFVDTMTSSPANVTSSPWNLRTRRAAACKAPRSPVNGVNEVNNVFLKKMSSPVRFNGNGGGERAKFSVGLSRLEVEDDFMKMTGRRLPRKPKKRPRAVQKQLDTLFPGLWLREITPDLYKVPDEIETGKVAFGDKWGSVDVVTNWGSLRLYEMIFDG
ncbi:hypothetical protein CTI12_AA596420 [Artemisia annua]|uniref:Uncharacterized protein n=1 Tax=Artemisia annua TaxID=35608 RepID=A0A2U1KJ60_ARTAN|nr:hypothetical protein CTI12_AA596420 [Artemisia annua]